MTTLTFTKRFLSLVALMGIVLMATGLHAQNLVNGAEGVIVNYGTIKFVVTDGEFQNENADGTIATILDNDNGTIEFANTDNVFAGTNDIGASTAMRLGGLMLYSLGTATQNIQGRYYTNLEMANGTANTAVVKQFGASLVYCSGAYTAAGADRDYGTGEFSYDGAAAQTIFAEAGATGNANIYNILNFEDVGVKTLTAGETNNVETSSTMLASTVGGGVDIQGIYQSLGNATFDQIANAGDLLVTGAGAEYNNTNGAATFNANVTVAAGTMTAGGSGGMTYNTGLLAVSAAGAVRTNGTAGDGLGDITFNSTTTVIGTSFLTTDGDGDLIVNTGTVTITDGTFGVTATSDNGQGTINSGGTLALADVGGSDALGHVDIATGQTLENTGIFTNATAYASRTNMLFADDSEMIYNGAGQSIVGTIAANPYGNLQSIGATKAGAENHINISSDLLVTTEVLDMTAGAGPFTLTMLDHTGEALYTGSTDGVVFEVAGSFQRMYNVYDGGDAYTGATPLTYNNVDTKVSITTLGSLVDLTLNILPETNPDPSVPAFSLATDVNRKITFSYNSTANDWVSEVTMGYRSSEEPTDGDVPIAALRFREYESPTNPSHKVSTNELIGRSTPADYTDGFAWISLAGIEPGTGTTLAEVINTNDLYLSGAPTSFITINHGRWSNPATWDEGIQPSSSDFAIVRHNVHVGFRRTSFDGGVAGGQNDEGDFAGVTNDRLASEIEIIVPDGTYTTPALIFGNNVGGATDEELPLTPWKLADVSTANLTNLNANATGTGLAGYTSTVFDNDVRNSATANYYHGLMFLNTNTAVTLLTLTNSGAMAVGEDVTVTVGE
ncbi:MAG: hypothetical protein PF588_03110 [Candidatus Kapabacteria bacterium]|jgi:hypothetical protein|nr:hypothetical protein [Candidatus Kapabacteria bacterium]